MIKKRKQNSFSSLAKLRYLKSQQLDIEVYIKILNNIESKIDFLYFSLAYKIWYDIKYNY